MGPVYDYKIRLDPNVSTEFRIIDSNDGAITIEMTLVGLQQIYREMAYLYNQALKNDDPPENFNQLNRLV